MDSNYSVLIVDDDRDLLSIIGPELAREGYQIHTATSSDEALSVLAKTPVSLVLLDIRLPGTGGLETLKIITRDFPKTRVVMFTGQADLFHALESRRLGADDFIAKPYDISDVIRIIERIRSGGDR